ncbi:MAG: LCCL domain-containing protein [Acidobacteriota bacterium]|nr:LCCL domain-containing protein [Acidobacteriota bacterium]
MKQCPKCNRTYDDSQAFCLMDGTPLTNESEVETVIRRQSPPPKKSRLVLWLGLMGLVILIGGVAVVGFLIYKFSKRGESTQGKRQNVVNISSTPSSTPRVTPTAATVTSSPDNESSPQQDGKSKTVPNDEDSEDITPISWDTTANGFKSDGGQIYKFRCPAHGVENIIWGSDIYTLDSSICTAAVHAGIFSLDSGGVVTVEFRPGRLTYGSTVRNGITSKTYGEYPKSYVVR